MHPLQIALHDGFRDSSVVIQVNGREVFNQTVTTDLTISRAGSVDVQAPAKAKVTVSAEPGGHRGSFEVDVAGTPFLAVSINREGKIVFRASKEAFLYM